MVQNPFQPQPVRCVKCLLLKSCKFNPILRQFESPTEAKDFSSSLCVQTGSGAHPASYPIGTAGSLSGGKARPGRDSDHSPQLVPRFSMSWSYTSSHPMRLHGVQRDKKKGQFAYFLLLLLVTPDLSWSVTTVKWKCIQ
jgi:hypothetical protein